MTPSPSTWTFLATGILGADVNLQAGNIICNYRNERENKDVLVRLGRRLHRTGCQKFGALVRNHRRIVPMQSLRLGRCCSQEPWLLAHHCWMWSKAARLDLGFGREVCSVCCRSVACQ